MSEDFTPHFPRSIDSTMLTCFDSCAQKWFDEFAVRISPTGISPDLHAGGAFAHGVETCRHALYAEKLPLVEALAKTYIAFTQFWGLYEPPSSNNKTYVATFCAIVDYFREYPPHEDDLQPYYTADGKPALEFTFGIPLPIDHPETGDPILFSGRFDELAVSQRTSRLCILDEKTTKSFFKNWASQWSMRGQFFGYVWAARHYNFDVQDFCTRGIAIQKTQYQHLQHGPITLPEWQLRDWHHWMLYKVEQMVMCWAGMKHAKEDADEVGIDSNPHNFWPKSYGEACTNYGNCSYMGICTQVDPRRWYYDFERRIWDPLAKNPTANSEQTNLDLVGMTLEQLGADK